MSWLSKEWGKVRKPIGNVLKDVSPLLAFTPLGPLGSAGAAALGQSIIPHSNLGSILKAGASNAAIGAGAHGLTGLAQGWLGDGGAAAASSGATGVGATAPPALDASLAGAPGAASSAMAPAASGGFRAGLQSALGTAGKAIKDQPLVTGQIASGVLQAREQGAQNALQQEQFDYQKKLQEDELKRKNATAGLLAPLFQQYLQKAGAQQDPWANYHPVSPYSGGMG